MKHYHQEIGSVMNSRRNRYSFVQLIGEHAVGMVQLAEADRKNNKRGLMSAWAHISKVNGEWLTLICPILHEGNKEFYRVSERIINNYSEVLGDFILDTHLDEMRKKVDEILELETAFYTALVPDNKQEATKKQWVDYTHSIGNMIYTMDRYGPESDSYYHSAASCVLAGKLLGQWLDVAIRE